VLALFRLAYSSRAGTEVESAELPYSARFNSPGGSASAAAKTSELGHNAESPAEGLEAAYHAATQVMVGPGYHVGTRRATTVGLSI